MPPPRDHRDDRPWQEPPPPRPAEFVTRDRAKQYVYRLEQIATERRGHFKGEKMGMTSFVEAVPTMKALESDLALTVDSVLAGRLRDRERGETEVPFVVAVEGVLERVRRARVLEEARRSSRAPAAWAQTTLLALLADAVRRLNAFAEVYDAKRLLAVPAPADVAHLLSHVEADAAAENIPAVGYAATPASGTPSPSLNRKVSPLVTAADAMEDLLRAARAEVAGARPPWRVTRATPTDPLVLSIGDGEPSAGAGISSPAPASLLGPGPAAERTNRAVAVLKFAHGVSVERTLDPEGETKAVHLSIADATASAVAKRLAPAGAAGAEGGAGSAPSVTLSPDADAAVRAYVLAAGKVPDALAPARLVAVMGVLRAVEKALDRALRPHLDGTAAAIVAKAVPREASRKAPVHREILATLAAAVPGFPTQRVSEVLDAVADGKAGPSATRPPDAAVLLAVLSRRWAIGKAFGDGVVGAGVWSDEDATQSIRDVVRLAQIRTALDRGQDPGAAWAAQFEAAAFGLLTRLARLAASA